MSESTKITVGDMVASAARPLMLVFIKSPATTTSRSPKPTLEVVVPLTVAVLADSSASGTNVSTHLLLTSYCRHTAP